MTSNMCSNRTLLIDSIAYLDVVARSHVNGAEMVVVVDRPMLALIDGEAQPLRSRGWRCERNGGPMWQFRIALHHLDHVLARHLN